MLVTISQKELDRISVLQQLYDKHLTLSRVAKLMDLGIHQVQRLLSRYQNDGTGGLSSRKLGKPANNRAPDELRFKILTLLPEKYSYFGPALTTEGHF